MVGKCERCPATKSLQSHHLFYRDDWFQTQIEDLEVLCDLCHEEEHLGPMPDWESPEEEKKYFYGLVSEAVRFFVKEQPIPQEMAEEMNELATKYAPEPPVVFQIRNCLRMAHASGVPFESPFTPLEARN